MAFKGLTPASGVSWRKSTYCGVATCVEVASRDGMVCVRDSKHENGPVLAFTKREFSDFVIGVKSGEFDEFTHGAPDDYDTTA
ncbi:MAG: DUF397 domain-containing protein [Kineosporiaceae bacterium]|nr:DUF397 domain-containing protein [Kineosporiaceae bacterium]